MRSMFSPGAAGRAAGRMLGLLLLSSAVAPAARAQAAGAISGTVRDSAGTPIVGVEVRVADVRGSARTDTAGAFQLANVPAGRRDVEFRRLGFEPKTVPTTVGRGTAARLAVTLDMLVAELDPVSVREDARQRQFLHEFWERKRRGFGQFITRQDIEERNPQNLSDMMRMVPGVRILPAQGQYVMRFARADVGRDCPPQFWIDGVRAFAFGVDDIPPMDVEGVEIYAGPSALPPQYNTRDGTTICGVVLIWSRLPGM